MTDDSKRLIERISTIMVEAGKPLSFQQIYSKLEADGQPMPADKPKLVIRRALYASEEIGTNKLGFFVFKENADEGPAIVKKAAASPKPAKAASPAPAAPTLTPGTKTAAKPVQPAEAPKPAGSGQGLERAIQAILTKAGRAQTFKQICSDLDAAGHDTSDPKVKAAARKVLYNAKLFDLQDGRFKVKKQGGFLSGFFGGGSSSAPKTEPKAPAKTPAARKKPAAAPQPKPAASAPKPKSSGAQPAKAGAKPASANKPATQAPEMPTLTVGAEKPVAGTPPAPGPVIDADAVTRAAQEAAAAAARAAMGQQGIDLETAKREAAAAAREAAVEAARETREATIQAAREAAVEAAREAAAEAARQAAEIAKTREAAAAAAREAAREAAAAAAREAAREAAAEAARQAAEIARAQESAAAAMSQEAIVQAAREAAAAAATAAREAVQSQQMAAPPEPVPAPPPAEAYAEEQLLMVGQRGTSIRDRAIQAIIDAGRPLSADEVFAILDADGMPLPQGKPRAVIERVLSNPRLFEEVEQGLYVPKQ